MYVTQVSNCWMSYSLDFCFTCVSLSLMHLVDELNPDRIIMRSSLILGLQRMGQWMVKAMCLRESWGRMVMPLQSIWSQVLHLVKVLIILEASLNLLPAFLIILSLWCPMLYTVQLSQVARFWLLRFLTQAKLNLKWLECFFFHHPLLLFYY